jgi:thiamine-phosphate pyrophosphorylase
MLPSLTPAVSRALEAARRYAHAAPAVEPLHLLHGLLEEEDGRAATLAAEAGLDRARYLAERGEAAASAASVPLAAATEAILYRARELAVERTGEKTVSGEGVLLALVRHDAGVAARLAALGLDAGRLEALLGGSQPDLPLEEPIRLADLTEQVDVARVLDAGFNRAREALRVVEDYCRFCLEDALLSSQLKELRHELTAAFEEQAPPGLLEARETLRDVGTSISLDSERERGSLAEVVSANLRRLQEALRSLEEFAKVPRPLLAERVEQLRYRSYTLERALLLGARARRLLRDARLYVLLSASGCASALDWTIAEAAAGGAGVVQLREKGLTDRELLARARDVRRWTRKAGVLFIVNDRPDVARLAEADGVHLGQDDLPVKEARRVLGPDALIGVSTHSLEQLRQAVLDGASYVGVGPVFPSGTKDFAEFPGLEFVKAALAETTLPAFAIGGINEETVGLVAAAGARRVAVSAAVARAEEPGVAAAGLLAALGP